MADVKLAVIGTGVMGETHVRAIQHDARAKLVAICDVNKPRLDEIQDRYSVPNAYTDAREMFRSHQIDGVVIATSDQFHVEPVSIAAEAGAHIMLEKPIATTVEDAETILNAAGRAQVKLMIGFVLRFTPAYVAIHDRVVSGSLGPLTMGFAKRACGLPEARRLGGRLTVNSYLSVHDVDTLLWNFGTDVESVYATKGEFILKDELHTPDYYWNLLKFRNGVTCVAHSLWTLPEASPSFTQSELVIHGTVGSAHLDVDGQWLRFAGPERSDAPDFLYGIGEPHAGAYRLEDEHFVECIVKDRTPIVNGIDGMNALKVILAAEESTRVGAPVPVALTRPTRDPVSA
jgi:UDP-N-acetylglucosamine 3-dehydrogenase